jgi:hypothetical protein
MQGPSPFLPLFSYSETKNFKKTGERERGREFELGESYGRER